jgi:hypothetical protein
MAVDAVEGFAEVLGVGIGGGSGVLDLDGPVVAAVRTHLLID